MVEPVILELAVNGATPSPQPARAPHACRDHRGRPGGDRVGRLDRAQPQRRADVRRRWAHAVEPYLAAWRPVLERHPDALLYPTMAAGVRGIPVARRWAHVDELARRGMGGMTLVDPGR